MSESWLVVGLGNPGEKYARNRHNVGHMVVDELAARGHGSFSRHKSGAQVAEVRLGILPGGAPGPKVILAKLGCYMNVSGGPTSALVQYFGIEPTERLLVVHDEMDIPAHQLRLKRGGGEGGHNGLRSISQSLGTKDYARLRFGIGRPPGRQDPADFVLGDLPAREREEWGVTIAQAADVVEAIAAGGFEATQQVLHTRN